MKVVINKCFGGFGLSLKAKKLLAKKKDNIDLYFYEFNYDTQSFIKVGENENDSSFITPLIKDYGDTMDTYDSNDYYDFEVKRNDEYLIKVIEELGDEASGTYARLKIIEIPDDIEFEIDSYDGVESVHEKHRVWE